MYEAGTFHRGITLLYVINLKLESAMKDTDYYRHQLIHKQDELDEANMELRKLSVATANELSTALTALTERNPPKLNVVEYILRSLVHDLKIVS